jgi:hypothetical protein
MQLAASNPKSEIEIQNMIALLQDTIKSWFGCELPQMSERVNRLRELGDALRRGTIYCHSPRHLYVFSLITWKA